MRKDGRSKDDIYAKAVKLWGYNFQVLIAIEEMAELTDALIKHHRNRVTDRDVINEIADVQIMMEQMAFIFGRREVEIKKSVKLQRLSKLIKKGAENVR